MADEARIMALLEEALDSDLTPKEICADCPELLPELEQRLTRCRNVDAMLESFFPSSSGLPPHRISTDDRLPAIPGHEVEEIIGQGSFGIIYRARHLKLKRSVAVKMLRSGEYASPLELTRFLREARAVAALHDPHVVQIHDVGDLDGRPWFTMELVEGGSLAKKLSGTPQPFRETAIMVSVLARSMHVAHQAGIVHRDLKPGNILLATDGSPKISDFGLASRFEEEPSLTLNGARLGTPSYMSPEQVTGADGSMPSLVDVYALGAILYEMLTGRPPFHAKTAAETQRMVLDEEPISPRKLNPHVPRDLETICLKCLGKTPARRYASAEALADDLDRYLRTEPIEARRANLAERAAKWIHRRTATAVALAAIVLLFVALGLWLAHFSSQRAQLRQAVGADLAEVAKYQSAGQWANAEASLRRAQARLDSGGPAGLRASIDQAWNNLSLASRLDAIHLERRTAGDLPYYQARANDDFKAAFSQAGLFTPGDPPDAAAARINASPIRTTLVAALDYWAVAAEDSTEQAQLLSLAKQCDPEEDAPRDRIRDPQTWSDAATAMEMAATTPITGHSISPYIALAERLKNFNGDPSDLLKRVQKDHPADFLANLTLSETLLQRLPSQAVIFARTALAARPDAGIGYSAVGDALRMQRQTQAAIEYYRKALSLDPKNARAQNNLGLALSNAGRLDEAVECCRTALAIDPNYTWAHFDMGRMLRAQGRLDEAAAQMKLMFAVKPEVLEVQQVYFGTMLQLGRGEQARAEWQQSLQSTGSDIKAWPGYPEFCLFIGNESAYAAARSAMLARFAAATDTASIEPIARACMTSPASPADLTASIALLNRALAAKSRTPLWVYNYFLFTKGLADYRAGKFDEAIADESGDASRVLGPCPGFITAMALKAKGDDAGAMNALAAAMIRFDWRAPKADSRDLWLNHILRREAQRKILTHLPDFLIGSYRPTESGERFALLGECQYLNRYPQCVELYSQNVAADPKMAQNHDINVGFTAASAGAALAMADPKAGSNLGDAERSHLRMQACQWLTDELKAAQLRAPDSDSESRTWLRRELNDWKTDPGLAPIRDEKSLQHLSPAERTVCAALWARVDEILKHLKNTV